MQTSQPCHHLRCGQPAVHTCAICLRHSCSEHLLRATFFGARELAHVVFDVCQTCLEQEVREQHVQGRDLSHWRKVG
jgi:hypothetical protein